MVSLCLSVPEGPWAREAHTGSFGTGLVWVSRPLSPPPPQMLLRLGLLGGCGGGAGGAPLWPPELRGGALLCLLGDAFDSPPAASPSLVHSLLEDLGHVVSGQERGRFSHVLATSRSKLLLCSPDSWRGAPR